jgi:hypothetical protein
MTKRILVDRNFVGCSSGRSAGFAPFKNDLRARVISIVMEGESAREAARLLNIGASTAIRCSA